jgi:hypothetical protein
MGEALQGVWTHEPRARSIQSMLCHRLHRQPPAAPTPPPTGLAAPLTLHHRTRPPPRGALSASVRAASGVGDRDRESRGTTHRNAVTYRWMG